MLSLGFGVCILSEGVKNSETTAAALATLTSRFDAFMQVSSPSLTPGYRGSVMLESLNGPHDCRTTYFEPHDGRAPVVPAEDLKSISPENALIQHLTPFLQQVFPHRVLVNSETKAWLVVNALHTRFNEKPDVFFCHPACYSPLPEPESFAQESQRRAFGVLTSMHLAEDAFIGDCKCTISNTALGEVVNHLHRLASYLKTRARGFLFDWRNCWLLEVDQFGAVLRRVIIQWDQVKSSVSVCACGMHVCMYAYVYVCACACACLWLCM